MQRTISENQSALIPWRFITDNVIVGYETLHWIRSKKVGRKAMRRVSLLISRNLLSRLAPIQHRQTPTKSKPCCQYPHHMDLTYILASRLSLWKTKNFNLDTLLSGCLKDYKVGATNIILRLGKRLWSSRWFNRFAHTQRTCFHIPKSISQAIENECSNFWWGMEDGKRKMHWKTWSSLCKPKSLGGWGLEIWNPSIKLSLRNNCGE